jgi:hypothetical protein
MEKSPGFESQYGRSFDNGGWMNDTYNEQGWIRRRDYNWRTDIPKWKANLNLRKNKDEWKGTIKIDGVQLPDVYTTSINLTPAFVTNDFYTWATAHVMVYRIDQEEKNNG